MANAVNVTTAKPKTGGAVFCAPAGTTLPTDARTALDEAFKCLGYISEEGMTNANSPTSEQIKAWGGDVVYSFENGKSDSFKFMLIEALNVDVLKFVYGSENVTGTKESGISITANNKEHAECCLVADILLRGGGAKRIVIPSGKVSAVEDISYKDNVAIGYNTTVTAMPDSNGNTHYEYIAGTAVQSSQSSEQGGNAT